MKTTQSAKREFLLTGIFLMVAALIHVMSYMIEAYSRIDILSGRYTGKIPLWLYETAGKILLIYIFYVILRFLAYKKKKSPWSVILMKIWAYIFVIAECFYYVCLAFYNQTLAKIQVMTSTATYIDFYNDTHGFKYAALYICIILGIVITGYITHARFLSVISAILLIAFMICFGFIDMQTIQIMGKNVGLVASSILFHSVESGGVFLLGMWLAFRRESEV